jgi:hypothetical protein
MSSMESALTYASPNGTEELIVRLNRGAAANRLEDAMLVVYLRVKCPAAVKLV